MRDKTITSYLVIAGLCVELLSSSAALLVSNASPITSVDTITPYQVMSSHLGITATNTGPVDNITLFYRYSANNYSDWCPGKDYAILTAGDYKTKTDDTEINYPQRMWYDEKNQLLYVVNYLKDNLQVWDVSNSDDISKISQLKHSTYLDFVHDVVVVNNWSYGGVDYGNIAFTVGHASPMYFNSIVVNLSTTPVFLQNVQLSTGELYKKLGYISVMQRGDCLYAAVSRLSGKFNIFNVSNPGNMVNMSFIRGTDIDPGLTNWWLATFDPTNQFLYASGMGTNQTITTFDVSDLSNPIAIGYQVNLNQSDYAFRYFDKTNLSRLYSINGSDITNDRSLDVFDVSNPEEWTIIAESGDTQGTGEFQTDFWTNDWAASRKWISGGNQTGIIVWNIRNITDIYAAGTFARRAYTNQSHMQWFDYNNSRIFVLAFGLGGGNSIYIVKWQISLAQESSWYEYDVDTAAPWSWDFNFPNGPGYYEFCSIGRKAGESEETFPVSADARCFFNLNTPPYVPHNPIPVNNSEDISLDVTLHWIGGDPNIDDIVTYDIYFGVSSPPPKVSSNQSATIYNPGTLEFSTTYYWKVIAWDNSGLSTDGSTWQFTTRNESNKPPYTPSNPLPANKAIYVNLNTTLSWIGGDPDPGDTVTYDIYFGTTNPPPKLISNQSISTYHPESMHENTTYYWRIIAWDRNTASTSSPIWSYTTMNTEQFIPSFILGRITNKSMYNEVIMFDVVKALKITFSPIHFSSCAPYEEITIDKEYIGLVRTHFIFAFCTVSPS